MGLDFFFLITVIILHRLVSLFFSLFLSLMFLLVCLSLSVRTSRWEMPSSLFPALLSPKGRILLRAASLLLHLFVLISSLSIFSQERAQTSADVVKRPLHTHSFDTPSCPLHLYVPFTEWSTSGNLSLHMHPATSVSLISVLNWAEREDLYLPISWSNKKFPAVTSRLLTVCPLGWQRESEGNIRRRSCHTPISALMSHIKQCPYI